MSHYLAGVEWKDRLPELVQQCLFQLLYQSHIFEAVGLENARFQADHLLQTYVHHFDIMQHNNQIIAKIQMTMTVIDRKNHNILKQKTFCVEEPVIQHSLHGFLKGLDTAFQHLQKDFMMWLNAEIHEQD